jgi:hypothetical protein
VLRGQKVSSDIGFPPHSLGAGKFPASPLFLLSSVRFLAWGARARRLNFPKAGEKRDVARARFAFTVCDR